MERKPTGYKDIRGDEIYDNDILREEPVDRNGDNVYWRVYYDEHLQQWYAYTDDVTTPLSTIAPYVWHCQLGVYCFVERQII